MKPTLTNKKQFKLKGLVAASHGKTAVVVVETVKVHPKYRKKYHSHKRYLVHDPQAKAKIGQTVMIESCRPISKKKKWLIV